MEPLEYHRPSPASDRSMAVWAIFAAIILAIVAVALRIMAAITQVADETMAFVDLAWFAVIAAAVVGMPAIHEYLRRN